MSANGPGMLVELGLHVWRRPNETQDQVPRPRARVAAKLKGVATLSGETSRGAVSCIAWLGVLGGIIIGVGPTTPARELERDQLGELGRDVCHRLFCCAQAGSRG